MMRWFYKIPLQFRSLFRKSRVEKELTEELSFHLERLIEEKIGKGMSWEEARYVALRELGGEDQIKEECRDMRRVNIVENLLQDIWYGLRQLRRNPAFTTVAVVSLALGIGANTAIFTLVRRILLRPLPFPDSGRIMLLREQDNSGESMSVSYPNFLDWQNEARSFSHLAASGVENRAFVQGAETEQVAVRVINWNLFSILGTKAAVGRLFDTADDQPGSPLTAILSHEFFEKHFDGNPDLAGRTVMLDGKPHAVVGVLPPGFEFLSPADICVALGPVVGASAGYHDRGNHNLISAIGRLKEGATPGSARVEMQGITEGLEREYPKSNSGIRATVSPVRDVWLGPVGPLLWALFGAVGFLLIIASVNIANLQLSRALRREREIAIRAALGAGRGRLLLQLAVESSILAMLGAGVGLLLGWMTLPGLAGLLKGAPRIDGARLDPPVLAYTLFVALLTTLLFGLLPALQLTRTGAGGALKGVGRTTTSGALSRKIRSGFAISEIALSLILLIGAGLMIRTMYSLAHIRPGFEPEHLLTMRFDLAGPGFEDKKKLRAFYTSFLNQIHQLPGITSAAVTVSLPIDGSQWGSVFVVGDQPVPPRAELPSAAFIPASEYIFRTMGTRVLRGRAFTAADTHESQQVCVINETMARRFWPGGDPIGKRIKQGWPEWRTPWKKIVGVVEDAKLDGVQEATPLEIYLPLWQETAGSVYMVVRSNLDRGSILKEVGQAFRSLAPGTPLYSIRSMDEVLDQGVARQHSAELLLAVFAGLALALSVIGVYGVVAHGVAQRTQEIGIRMALGASAASVFKLVVGHGLRLLDIGLALGISGAFFLERILASMLYGVSPTDPATFACVAAILSAAVFLACYIPARRATNFDPMVALRYE